MGRAGSFVFSHLRLGLGQGPVKPLSDAPAVKSLAGLNEQEKGRIALRRTPGGLNRRNAIRMGPYEKDMLYAPEGKIVFISFHRSSLVAVSALAIVSLKPSVSPKARTAARLTALSA